MFLFFLLASLPMCTVSSATFPQTYICFYRFHDLASLKDVAGYAGPLNYLLPWDLQTQSAITGSSPDTLAGWQSAVTSTHIWSFSFKLTAQNRICVKVRLLPASDCFELLLPLYSGLWSLKIIFLPKLILFPLGRHCIFPLQNPAWLSTISAPSSGLACITLSCRYSSPPGPRWIWAGWGLSLARGKASVVVWLQRKWKWKETNSFEGIRKGEVWAREPSQWLRHWLPSIPGSSQLPWTAAPGDPMPLLASVGTAHTWCT